MSGENQPSERVRHLRDKAQGLEQAAQHAEDPADRQRLTDEALRIRQELERDEGPGTGTMDPM
ncbi:DUF6381 family protein [Streptomyces sp. NPDC048507]|uniref:DUF6381 family protein n=1 Tax=Streptomyces sp. NPDC048507 TaxID=3365560 RepID=UPI003723DA77